MLIQQPIAAPANEIEGVLLAECLKPRRISLINGSKITWS